MVPAAQDMTPANCNDLGTGRELTIISALAYALSKHEMQHRVRVTYLMQGIDSLKENTFLSLLLKHLLMFAQEGIRIISLIAESHLLEQRKEVNNSPWKLKGTKGKLKYVHACSIGNKAYRGRQVVSKGWHIP